MPTKCSFLSSTKNTSTASSDPTCPWTRVIAPQTVRTTAASQATVGQVGSTDWDYGVSVVFCIMTEIVLVWSTLAQYRSRLTHQNVVFYHVFSLIVQYVIPMTKKHLVFELISQVRNNGADVCVCLPCPASCYKHSAHKDLEESIEVTEGQAPSRT